MVPAARALAASLIVDIMVCRWSHPHPLRMLLLVSQVLQGCSTRRRSSLRGMIPRLTRYPAYRREGSPGSISLSRCLDTTWDFLFAVNILSSFYLLHIYFASQIPDRLIVSFASSCVAVSDCSWSVDLTALCALATCLLCMSRVTHGTDSTSPFTF